MIHEIVDCFGRRSWAVKILCCGEHCAESARLVVSYGKALLLCRFW